MEIVIGGLYFLVIVSVIIRIMVDTHSTPKTLAYILLVILLPVAGIYFYFAFGINYRHPRAIARQQRIQQHLDEDFLANVNDETAGLVKDNQSEVNPLLVSFINGMGHEFLTINDFKLLINGEQKFPEVLAALEQAKEFIHMDYYAWENDTRGNEVKDVLLRKVREGVHVRVLYDDYASRQIRRNIVKQLKQGGVEIFPKIRVRLRRLANRLNHRDHRKVIIIDGHTGFLGGINISDRYDNSIDDKGPFWRDTHLKVVGPMVLNLQRHFIISWNSSQPTLLDYYHGLFPSFTPRPAEGISALGQVVAGGPIYPHANIMLTYFRIFTLATKRLYVTNPYFIPNDSILNALKQAAIAGVDVRLLLPGKSDSRLVSAASRFYYAELLHAGVKLYLYQRGFVHAKTVVCDGSISIVGSANLDIRSFDLNFEIMAVVYGIEFGKQMESVFLDDLKNAQEITEASWGRKKFSSRLKYAMARLVSAFL